MAEKTPILNGPRRYYHKPEETFEFELQRNRFAKQPLDRDTVWKMWKLFPYHRFRGAQHLRREAAEARKAGDEAKALALEAQAEELRCVPADPTATTGKL